MSFEEKKILINSYFMPNFNYCPLVWFKLFTLENRKFTERSTDYETSYEELLKVSNSSMNVKKLRALCIELHKTVNKLNSTL